MLYNDVWIKNDFNPTEAAYPNTLFLNEEQRVYTFICTRVKGVMNMKKMYQVPEVPPNMRPRPRIKALVDDAFQVCRVLFVCGHFGTGKSMFMTLYFDKIREEVCWLDVYKMKDVLSVIRNLQKSSQGKRISYFVINDVHRLDEKEIEELKHIILHSEQKFVLLSHVLLPHLFEDDLRYHVRMMGLEVLHYRHEEIKIYFKYYDIELTEEEIDFLEEKTRGWQLYLFFVLQNMQVSGLSCGEEVLTQARNNLYECLDKRFMEEFTERERILLLKIGCFETISLQMIKSVISQAHVEETLNDIIKKDSFISFCDSETYHIERGYLDYFLERRNKFIDKKEIDRIYRQAGHYYAKENEVEKAIICYLTAESYQNVVDILEEMTVYGIGLGDAFRYKKYFFMLPEDWIAGSPDMCMQLFIFSLQTWDLESAMKWKKYIKEKCGDEDQEENIYQKWRDIYAYLDLIISFPSSEPLNDKLRRYGEIAKKEEFTMHRTSFTAGRLSVINGEWDMSVWAKADNEEFQRYMDYFRAIYKEDFDGVENLIQAEYGYEKNNLEKAMIHAVSAIYDIQDKDSIDLLFAACNLQMKIMVLSGQEKTMAPILNNMERQMQDKYADWFVENYRAAVIYHKLYKGEDLEDIVHWVEEEAPNEDGEFELLHYDFYFLKVRVYILQEKYLRGIALLEKLRSISTMLGRNTDLISIETLSAGIHDRMGDRKKACEILLEALGLAEKFGYVRRIGDYGTLIYKIMMDLSKHHPGVGDTYFDECMRVVRQVSENFPRFLKMQHKTRLSEAELAVLRLIAEAKTNGEIARDLCISVNTVKFHCKNIYQKLGVKNRSGAVEIGKQEMLI